MYINLQNEHWNCKETGQRSGIAIRLSPRIWREASTDKLIDKQAWTAAVCQPTQ